MTRSWGSASLSRVVSAALFSSVILFETVRLKSASEPLNRFPDPLPAGRETPPHSLAPGTRLPGPCPSRRSPAVLLPLPATRLRDARCARGPSLLVSHKPRRPPGGHPAAFPQPCPPAFPRCWPLCAVARCSRLPRPPAGSSPSPRPVLLLLDSRAPGTSVRHTVGTKSVLLGRGHPQPACQAPTSVSRFPRRQRLHAPPSLLSPGGPTPPPFTRGTDVTVTSNPVFRHGGQRQKRESFK